VAWKVEEGLGRRREERKGDVIRIGKRMRRRGVGALRRDWQFALCPRRGWIAYWGEKQGARYD
jgi:hypothetical protein